MKELTNEQRVRLEMVTRDEFRIRKNEVTKERQEAFDSWKEAEVTKVAKSVEMKAYLKMQEQNRELLRKMEEIRKSIRKQGFDIHTNPQNKTTVYLIGDQYGSGAHDEYNRRRKETLVNADHFTRAMNEVLAVIWSMEKPFNECLNLIKTATKSLK